jgi:hypothetical protein
LLGKDLPTLSLNLLIRLTVDDAVFHEGASIENGELVTPVGKVNMRLVAVEEK